MNDKLILYANEKLISPYKSSSYISKFSYKTTSNYAINYSVKDIGDVDEMNEISSVKDNKNIYFLNYFDPSDGKEKEIIIEANEKEKKYKK